MTACTNCNLSKTRKCIVLGEGPENAQIFILGEAPGQEEDITGRPFVGSAGRLLDKMLKEAGLDRGTIFVDNLVKCRPVAPPNTGKENRPPSSEEIELCCFQFEDVVQRIKPKLIIAAGNVPLKYLLRDRTANISKKRGQIFWSDKYQCYISAVYHPAAVLRKYEFYNTTVEDFKRIKDFLEKGTPTKLSTNYQLVDTPEKLSSFLPTLAKQPVFSFDLETTDLNFLTERIICLGVSWQVRTGYVLPFLKPDGSQYWDDQTYDFILTELTRIFANDALKVGQNGSFDVLFLKKYLMPVNNFMFDTMLAHHLLDENAEGMHGLKEMAWLYTDMGGYEAGLEQYQKEHKLGKQMLSVPYDVLLPYCAGDVDCTLRLYYKFLPMLQEQNLLHLFTKLVMPLCNVLIETAYRGVQIDIKYLKELEAKFDKQLEEIKQKFFEAAGKEINLNSSKQLQQLLFQDLQLPSIKQTATGNSTDEEVLTALAKKHPVPKILLEYRKLNKLQSTYIKGLTYDSNYRVHTEYKQHGTQTGRLSSREPNLQNIPHTNEMKNIYCAKEGYTLVQIDFSAAEFRAWGNYAGDERMIRDLINGLDIHRKVASTVFGIPESEVTKEQRRTAKMSVFGMMYGRGPKSIAEEHGISVTQAQRIITTFFNMYPKAKRWLDSVVLEAKQNKQLRSFFGRVRRLPTFDSPNEEVRAQAERQAKNFPIQSCVADLTNWTAVRLFPILKNYDTYLVLQVHDCLVYECPDRFVPEVAKLVKTEAERKIKGFKVPMVVELQVGKKWGEMQNVQID